MGKRWLTALGMIFFPLIMGSLIGSYAQSATDPHYLSLIKPSWNPPGWIFGPVWSALYLFMGWASWRIWKLHKIYPKAVNWALLAYGAQLLLNLFWTPLFFLLHRPIWALYDIAALIIFIAVTMALFSRLDKWAGRLLAPYLIWALFAALLNWRIVQLNAF